MNDTIDRLPRSGITSSILESKQSALMQPNESREDISLGRESVEMIDDSLETENRMGNRKLPNNTPLMTGKLRKQVVPSLSKTKMMVCSSRNSSREKSGKRNSSTSRNKAK